MQQLPAYVFVAATVAVVLFQVALVAGAPWGEFTLGGRYRGKLPATGRLIAAASVPLLLMFSAIILARAGLGPVGWVPSPRTLVWVVVVFSALSSLANCATPSKRERVLWLPVSLCMLTSSVAIALS